jgi:hypothetical protein
VIDKMDVYRMSDPVFRVHARLFRLQEAILRSSMQQIRAAKQTVVAQAAGGSALLASLLTLIVGVFKIEWNSVPVIVILCVGAAAILIHVLEVVELKSDEREFDRLLADAGGQGVETWVDFSESLVAAYGTRLKMLSDALIEAPTLHKAGQLSDAAFQQRTQYLNQTRDFCIAEVTRLSAMNEALFTSGRRSEEDYESVKNYVEVALAGAIESDSGSH